MIWRTFFVWIACTLLVAPSQAQQNTDELLRVLNGLNRNLGVDIDSTVFYTQKIGQLSPGSLQREIHELYALGYLSASAPPENKSFGYSLLAKLETSTPVIKVIIAPIVQWVRIRKETNSAKLQAYVNQYISYLAGKPEVLGNRVERYALLIHQDLETKQVGKPVKDALWQATTERIAHNVSQTYYDPNKLTGEQLIHRAYYRYLMAYVNAQNAQVALKLDQRDKAIELYAAAVQDGPDEIDGQNNSGYFFESLMLFNQEEPVTDFLAPYADQLIAKGDTNAALKTLADLAFTNHAKIPGLKAYHQKVMGKKQTFSEFWTGAINDKYKLAEPFSVTTLSGQAFTSDQYKGRWILLDFWGTWCKPCVAEMPELQHFYTDLTKNNRTDLTILALACHDVEQKVNDFMAKNKYGFAVAMGNEILIKQFRVGGYPTKVLITPEGRRIRIDFSQNWIDRVHAFMNP